MKISVLRVRGVLSRFKIVKYIQKLFSRARITFNNGLMKQGSLKGWCFMHCYQYPTPHSCSRLKIFTTFKHDRHSRTTSQTFRLFFFFVRPRAFLLRKTFMPKEFTVAVGALDNFHIVSPTRRRDKTTLTSARACVLIEVMITFIAIRTKEPYPSYRE